MGGRELDTGHLELGVHRARPVAPSQHGGWESVQRFRPATARLAVVLENPEGNTLLWASGEWLAWDSLCFTTSLSMEHAILSFVSFFGTRGLSTAALRRVKDPIAEYSEVRRGTTSTKATLFPPPPVLLLFFLSAVCGP